MFLDKNFKYILQNEKHYWIFTLDSGLYDTNKIIQNLEFYILYDKQNNIHRSTFYSNTFTTTYEHLMMNFLYPNKILYPINLNQNITEQLLKEFK